MTGLQQSADPFEPAVGWKGRGFAFLRFIGFVVLSCIFIVGFFLLADWILRALPITAAARIPEAGLPMQIAMQTLGALAATALMARLTGRKLRDFGLGGGDRLRNFLVGAATGIVSLSLLLLVMHLAAGFTLTPARGTSSSPLSYGLLCLLLMLGVSFSEETIWRGYALVALSQSISFWPAALATSALFGLMHGFNDGETLPGLVSAALFGLVVAYSYRRTRSLWFAYGVHASWDYGESFVFGVPNSGTLLPGGLFEPQFAGPSWLTGGSAGPEGSVLVLIALGAMLFVVRRAPRPHYRVAPEAG